MTGWYPVCRACGAYLQLSRDYTRCWTMSVIAFECDRIPEAMTRPYSGTMDLWNGTMVAGILASAYSNYIYVLNLKEWRYSLKRRDHPGILVAPRVGIPYINYHYPQCDHYFTAEHLTVFYPTISFFITTCRHFAANLGLRTGHAEERSSAASFRCSN
ncbi:hypothetical protein IW262DRAFT_1044694 [Armillaria fumosa]|nr:hypothetical protein IW262DRAFT_1044694 [Armillaria fumosa]